jgi:hypothetical protein
LPAASRPGPLSVGGVRTMVPPNAQMFQARNPAAWHGMPPH